MKVLETLAAIDAPHFFAGVVLHGSPGGDREGDRATAAADIIRYMVKQRWDRRQIRAYCIRKGWKISVVSCSERDMPDAYQRPQASTAR